jgi:AcrR family transcriptional regulator
MAGAQFLMADGDPPSSRRQRNAPSSSTDSPRQRLVRVVPAAVCEAGFAALTAEEISARAGLPPHMFYEHFRDEEDCFIASYRHHAGWLIATVNAAAAPARSWQERTRCVLSALLRFLAEHPDVARMGVIEAMAAGPGALAERNRVVDAFQQLLGEAPAPLAAPGPAPRLLLQTTAGAVLQLIYTWIVNERTKDLEQLLPTCAYIALVALLGPDAAAEECLGREPTAASG